MECHPSSGVHHRLLSYVEPATVIRVATNTETLARVAWAFYRQSRDINRFLKSNNSVSRTNYFRILALASIDLLLTLPIGIVIVTLNATQGEFLNGLPFYYGWTGAHRDSRVAGVFHYADLVSQGTSTLAQIYFTQWTSPVLAFAIFALFGITSEARASYWRTVCTIGGWFGWKLTPRARRAPSPLGDIEFGERPPQGSMALGLEYDFSPLLEERMTEDNEIDRTQAISIPRRESKSVRRRRVKMGVWPARQRAVRKDAALVCTRLIAREVSTIQSRSRWPPVFFSM